MTIQEIAREYNRLEFETVSLLLKTTMSSDDWFTVTHNDKKQTELADSARNEPNWKFKIVELPIQIKSLTMMFMEVQ